jgi:hypothetical protein
MDDLTAAEAAFQNVMLFTIGCMIFGAGLQSLLDQLETRKRFVRADGRVVRISDTQLSTDPRRNAYRVEIEFNMPNGIRRRITQVIWSSYGMVYAPGEAVKLWYDPEWPERAEVLNPRNRMITASAAVSLGLALMVSMVYFGVVRW